MAAACTRSSNTSAATAATTAYSLAWPVSGELPACTPGTADCFGRDSGALLECTVSDEGLTRTAPRRPGCSAAWSACATSVGSASAASRSRISATSPSGSLVTRVSRSWCFCTTSFRAGSNPSTSCRLRRVNGREPLTP
uniref:Uncharacterized protein n=1 Tax=Ixodes ricinus TaxID=34613 RepID=A0A6B0UUB4_IXORI